MNNKIGLKVFLVAVIVTHCGSANAGWFDNKKKSVGKVKQKVSATVAKTQADLPVESAVAKAPAAKGSPTDQKTSAVVSANMGTPAAVTPTAQSRARFFDMGSSGTKSDKEIAEEDLKKEQGKVRLSQDETKKMKEEMEKLQQVIRTARDAKQAAQTARVQGVKPVSIPTIPKLPVLTSTSSTVPTASVRPESYKNPTASAGYKK